MKNSRITPALALVFAITSAVPSHGGLPTLDVDFDGDEFLLSWESLPLNPGSATEIFCGFQLEESADLATWTPRGAEVPTRIGGGAANHRERIPLESARAFYRLSLILDLAGEDLGGADLSGADLGGADLEGADLSGADLSGANLLDARYANITIRSLGGPGIRPVREAIPAMGYADGGTEFSADHPDLPGVEISHNTILLAFKPETTTAEANAVLAAYGASIIGGVPSPFPDKPAIFFLQLPTADHGQLGAVLAGMRSEFQVEAVAENARLGLDAVPNNDYLELGDWPWTPGFDPPLGNWGMRAAKVPQMWNFNTKLRQMIAAGQRPETIDVAVLDSGFDWNSPEYHHLRLLSTVEKGSHGAHVMGIIGARFSFGDETSLGIDGVNPFARLNIADAYGEYADFDDLIDVEGGGGDDENLTSFLHAIDSLNKVVWRAPDASVINLSLGYGWHKRHDDPSTTAVVEDASRDPMTDLAVQKLVREESEFRQFLWQLFPDSGPLLVSSAGNSSNFFDRNAVLGGIDARWNSPWNYAALAQGDTNVVVVEATKNEAGDYYVHSCLGGHVKAPGEGILSYVWPNPKNANLPMKRLTGTSMAAPHVTGVASYMRMIEPSLSNAQIRDILMRANGVAQMGAPLDAFAAVIEIDRVTGRMDVLRMLVDVNDNVINGSVGAIEDGNTRVERKASTTTTPQIDPPSPPIESIYTKQPGEIEGDGKVDMADFRRWRDWLLQYEEGWDSELIDLDGADSGMPHYKMDLNADGSVREMARENLFPRGDFNGDGRIHRHDQVFVPGAINALASDFEVLRLAEFQEDRFWSKFYLDQLFDSFDLHVSLYEVYRHNWAEPDQRIDEIMIEFSEGDPGMKPGAYPIRIPVPELEVDDPTARFTHEIITLPTPPFRFRPIITAGTVGSDPNDLAEWLDEPRIEAKPGSDVMLVPKLRTDLGNEN